MLQEALPLSQWPFYLESASIIKKRKVFAFLFVLSVKNNYRCARLLIRNIILPISPHDSYVKMLVSSEKVNKFGRVDGEIKAKEAMYIPYFSDMISDSMCSPNLLFNYPTYVRRKMEESQKIAHGEGLTNKISNPISIFEFIRQSDLGMWENHFDQLLSESVGFETPVNGPRDYAFTKNREHKMTINTLRNATLRRTTYRVLYPFRTCCACVRRYLRFFYSNVQRAKKHARNSGNSQTTNKILASIHRCSDTLNNAGSLLISKSSNYSRDSNSKPAIFLRVMLNNLDRVFVKFRNRKNDTSRMFVGRSKTGKSEYYSEARRISDNCEVVDLSGVANAQSSIFTERFLHSELKLVSRRRSVDNVAAIKDVLLRRGVVLKCHRFLFEDHESMNTYQKTRQSEPCANKLSKEDPDLFHINFMLKSLSEKIEFSFVKDGTSEQAISKSILNNYRKSIKLNKVSYLSMGEMVVACKEGSVASFFRASCSAGHHDIVLGLLQAQAHVNCAHPSDLNLSPLQLALWDNNFETSQLLLHYGAASSLNIFLWILENGLVDAFRTLYPSPCELEFGQSRTFLRSDLAHSNLNTLLNKIDFIESGNAHIANRSNNESNSDIGTVANSKGNITKKEIELKYLEIYDVVACRPMLISCCRRAIATGKFFNVLSNNVTHGLKTKLHFAHLKNRGPDVAHLRNNSSNNNKSINYSDRRRKHLKKLAKSDRALRCVVLDSFVRAIDQTVANRYLFRLDPRLVFDDANSGFSKSFDYIDNHSRANVFGNKSVVNQIDEVSVELSVYQNPDHHSSSSHVIRTPHL